MATAFHRRKRSLLNVCAHIRQHPSLVAKLSDKSEDLCDQKPHSLRSASLLDKIKSTPKKVIEATCKMLTKPRTLFQGITKTLQFKLVNYTGTRGILSTLMSSLFLSTSTPPSRLRQYIPRLNRGTRGEPKVTDTTARGQKGQQSTGLPVRRQGHDFMVK